MASSKIKDDQAKNIVSMLPADPARARLEIDELLGDNDVTNLYLLALEAMQKEDPSKSVQNKEDWWTFHSLSSIHGLPAEQWDGIPNGNSRGPLDGYCTHGSLLFPTWHRVYIGMFEQAMVNKVSEIAALFTSEPEKSIYQRAAGRFRLPFWDPFLPRNTVAPSAVVNEGIWGIPKILAAEKVWVKRPGKADLDPIDNPLYKFTFQNEALARKGRKPIPWNSVGGLPPQGRQYTIRAPGMDGETNVFGRDNSDEDRMGLNLRIQRQAINMSTKLWKLLSPHQSNNQENRGWINFATHFVLDPRSLQPRRDPRNPSRPLFEEEAISLESWHDTIHGTVGTGWRYAGHMGNPAVAGFDPIFWLHHCNIDRLLAIYQALYPDKWFNGNMASYTSAKLYPFRKNANGDLWDTSAVRDWKSLGFAIPGDKDLDQSGRQALATHLNEYYNWATSRSFPPRSVSEKWPRDLRGSVALNGPRALPQTQPPVVRFDALDVSRLVTRNIVVPTAEMVLQSVPKAELIAPPEESLQVTVEDKTIEFEVEDDSAKPEVNPPETVKDGSMLTWNARIRVKKFAFDGPFNVHIFIGKINDGQTQRFITKKNEVGFASVFASPSAAPCSNCIQQRDDGIIYEDAVPLTPSLFAYLKSNTVPEADGPIIPLRTLETFEPAQVVPFLKANIGWRVTDLASNLIDDEQKLKDSGLEISVGVRKFDLPTTENPLGLYHPAEVYEEITNDKVGGFGFGVPSTA